jgi:hypothetical protein
MNFASREDIAALKQELELLRAEVRGIKGAPIVQGYVGKRLDLNDNFNIIEHSKTHTEINSRLAALEAL